MSSNKNQPKNQSKNEPIIKLEKEQLVKECIALLKVVSKPDANEIRVQPETDLVMGIIEGGGYDILFGRDYIGKCIAERKLGKKVSPKNKNVPDILTNARSITFDFDAASRPLLFLDSLKIIHAVIFSSDKNMAKQLDASKIPQNIKTLTFIFTEFGDSDRCEVQRFFVERETNPTLSIIPETSS